MTNALIVRPRDAVEGEIVGPGLFLEESPFRQGWRWLDVPNGGKLSAYAEAAAKVLPHGYGNHLELWIDEQRIDRAYWSQVTPKPGRTVYVRVRPQGKTGKNILRAALMIAVMVAAYYFFGPTAPFITTTLSLSGFAAAAASAAIIAVVSTVAMMGINALIPAPGLTGDNSQKDPKYQLTGSSNSYAPYQPIPRVFGKTRLYPVVAGHPYSEVVGNKQYLRMLLCVGWGPLRISDIRIGNTPITAYKNVEVEITEGGPAGWSGNAPITVYNRKVIEQSLSTELKSSTGTSAPLTTGLNVVEISLDLAFPFGLMKVNKNGNHVQTSVVIKVEYSVHGSGTWNLAPLESAYNDSNQTVNTGAGTITVRGSTSDLVRGNARFKVPSGQYDVRLTRTTSDAVNGSSGDQVIDRSFWTTLRYFSTDAPVLQDQVTLIAIRMQASDQLNGTPNQISCLAESYLPVYGIGAELITSGDGTATTGWTAGNSAVLSATGGRLRVTNSASVANGYASQSLTVVAGHRYQVYFDKFVGTAATRARVKAGTAPNDGTYLDDTISTDATGDYAIVTPAGTTMVITLMCEGLASQYSEFDNISVKDLDANTTWSYQITRSPAWAYAHLLRWKSGQSYLPDSRIDIATLQAWNTACGGRIGNSNSPRWAFDGVIQGGTVFEALRTVAACGRAAYTMRDGLFSIVQDKQQATAVQVITPKNSWGYQGTRTYLDMPHAYRVEYQNAAKDYVTDEQIVYADTYNSGNATKFEVLQLFGVTDSDTAWREGRYHIAVAQLRPEEHRVSMDIEALRCTKGDRVELAYDVMVVGQAYGRVTALAISGPNTIGFTLDNDIHFDPGKTYQLRTRDSDGTVVVRAVTNSNPELVTNGDGSTTVGWTAVGCTLASTSGQLVVTWTSGTAYAYQQITGLVIGETYLLAIDLIVGTGGSSQVNVGTTANGQQYGTANVAGTAVGISFVATATNVYIALTSSAASGWVSKFDNISLKDATGNQVTCAAETTAGGVIVGDIYVFGESGIVTAPMIVKKVEPADDLAAQLTLTNYDDNIYTADTGSIPAFSSYISTDVAKTAPMLPVVNLRGDGTTQQLNNGNWILNRIGIDIYNGSSNIPVVGNEVQYRETVDATWRGTQFYPAAQTTVYIADAGVLIGHAYQVRVRAKGENGLYSDWVQPTDVVIIGTSVAPAQPTGASVTPMYRSNYISWTPPTDLDLAFVEVFASGTNTFGSAVVVGKDITGHFTHDGLTANVFQYYWLVAVDYAGNTSSPLALGGFQPLSIATYEGIGADNVLTPAEKQIIIREFTQLTNEKSGIDTQATNYGVTTEKTAYDNAYSTLNTYLTGLSPLYTDTTQNTNITRTTWNTNWAALYSARQALLTKIDAVAGTLANWSGVIDDNGAIPDPNSTGGDTTIPDSTFVRGSGTGFGVNWSNSAHWQRIFL